MHMTMHIDQFIQDYAHRHAVDYAHSYKTMHIDMHDHSCRSFIQDYAHRHAVDML